MRVWLPFALFAVMSYSTIASAQNTFEGNPGLLTAHEETESVLSGDEVVQAELVLREFLDALFAGDESRLREYSTEAFRAKLDQRFANPDYADFLRTVYSGKSYQIEGHSLSGGQSLVFSVRVSFGEEKSKDLKFRICKVDSNRGQAQGFFVDGEIESP